MNLKQLLELKQKIDSMKWLPKNNLGYLMVMNELNKRIEEAKGKEFN